MKMEKNMKKIFFLLLVSLGLSLCADDNITGFWYTVNKKTGKPGAVVAVYSYKGKYYGKIIGTHNEKGVLDDTIYHPKSRAPGLEGKPFYSGLDIVWDAAQDDGEGRYKGYVVDPVKGKIYHAELWRDSNNLILRGKLFIFGRNEVWPPFTQFTKEFPKPELAKLIPQRPIVD